MAEDVALLDPEAFAGRLDDADRAHAPFPPVAAEAGMTLGDAYRIQRAWVARRVAAGHRRIGYKAAFTGLAIQRMLDVDAPAYGVLFDDMRVTDGGSVSAARFVQPRVEAELAFVMGRPLRGADVSPTEIAAAVERIVPALEIVDGRIGPRPTAIDIVADNAGAAGIVLGESRIAAHIADLASVEAALRRNGAVEDTGSGAAVLGDPIRALCWLLDALDGAGGGLDAGDIVLSGSLTKALPVTVGDAVRADFGDLGAVAVSFR